MKSPLVSMAAVLFCGAVLAVVGLFGYSRYKAAEAEDAAFRAQLHSTASAGAALGARMPDQLPPRATSAPAASPTPQ